MRAKVFLTVVVALAALLPATALASRPAGPKERVAIAAAWSGSPTTLADTTCLRIRVSTLRPRWAALMARFTPACEAQVFDGSTFLKRQRDGRWAAVVGGSSVDPADCALIPLAARRDLPAFTAALGC